MTEQTYLLMHRHINGYGRLFGGQLMQWIDELAGIVSMRHAGGRITTASIDNLNFKAGAYLNDICKKHSGLSLYNFGMTYCIKEAARLLSESSYTVSEVEAYLGFTNSTQFYKEFKKAYGMTPAKYKRRTG